MTKKFLEQANRKFLLLTESNNKVNEYLPLSSSLPRTVSIPKQTDTADFQEKFIEKLLDKPVKKIIVF